MEDVIDMTAGLRILKKTGDPVEEGEPIAVFYTSDEAKLENAERVYMKALKIEPERPAVRPLILSTVE